MFNKWKSIENVKFTSEQLNKMLQVKLFFKLISIDNVKLATKNQLFLSQ